MNTNLKVSGYCSRNPEANDSAMKCRKGIGRKLKTRNQR
jgi:hypothetical protein